MKVRNFSQVGKNGFLKLNEKIFFIFRTTFINENFVTKAIITFDNKSQGDSKYPEQCKFENDKGEVDEEREKEWRETFVERSGCKGGKEFFALDICTRL